MGLTLLVINAALLASLFKQRCVHDGKILINPFFGLTLGFVYYVLLPCTVMLYFSEEVGSLTVFGDVLSPDNAEFVLGYTTLLLSLVWLGQWIAKGKTYRSRVRAARTQFKGGGLPHSRRRSTDLPNVLLLLTWLALLAYAFTIRDSLFAGYDETVLADDSVWAARGSMSSFYSIICLCLAAIVINSKGPLSKWSIAFYALVYGSASVILLSLGARLYVATGAISMLALASFQMGGIALRTLAAYLGGAAIAFGSVGVLRSGNYSGAGGVLLNVALEPLLTSISLFTLLARNSLILFGKPWMFPADFQAVLPSVIFPEKSLLFNRLDTYGYIYEAPVGGFHLYFSGIINFGLVGFALMFCLGSFLLGRLTNLDKKPSNWRALVTIALSGATTFTLFRDPFFIALVKNVLLMAVVVPAAMMGVRLYSKPRAPAPLMAGNPRNTSASLET